ncbi:MAG: hypothetical protein HONBIEJF_00405 [Fimbriimonadaceae bacterium]|nr:hypothetical protein [Fimbriimonadaceae bacterium]
MIAALALCAALPFHADLFTSDYLVPEPIRLAITPTIDGKLAPDEWDSLFIGEGHQASYQWEPGRHYVCAKLPMGQDLIASFDFNADGWLVGKDNLQIRASWKDGKTTATAFILDCTDREGPKWVPAPLIEDVLKCGGSPGTDSWTVELGFQAVGLPIVDKGVRFAFRSDTVALDSAQPDPFLPRKMSGISLQMEKTQNSPPGLAWKAEYRARSVAPGDAIKIKVAMRNVTQIRRFEMFTEGLAKDQATVVAEPFPKPDEKGRASVTYDAKLSESATTGYRVLRTTLVDDAGSESWLRTSYQVSDLVTFDPRLPGDTKFKANDSQIVRGLVHIRSRSGNRLDGKLTIRLPKGWTVSKGSDVGFSIYHSRGMAKVNLELIVPPGAKGAYPLTYIATIGDKVIEQIIPFAIQ